MSDETLPCPKCEYDLQGQLDPRCPECGASFESHDQMVAAVRANTVFRRVLRWRKRIALTLAAGMLIGAGVIPPLSALQPLVSRKIFATYFMLTLLPLAIGGGIALGLLIQVIRRRFSRYLPIAQRRVLTGSIPLLLVFVIPLAVWVFLLGALIASR